MIRGFSLLPVISFPFLICFVPGLYLHDVFILLVVADQLIRGVRSMTAPMAGFSLAAVVLMLIGFGQTIFGASEFSLEITDFPWKVFLFGVYWQYFSGITFKGRIEWIVLLMLFPIAVSTAAYFNPTVNDWMMSFWGRGKYSGLGRFGGVFGGDVNSFGLFATLILALAVAAYLEKRASLVALALSVGFATVSILLSGTRTGLIAAPFAALAMVPYSRKNARRVLWRLALLAALFGAFAYLFLAAIDPDSLVLLRDRFSLARLQMDVAGEGNVAAARNFLHALVPFEPTLWQHAFGIDYNIMFVDSAYLAIYVKYGVAGLVVFASLAWRYLVRNRGRMSPGAVFCLAFSLLVGLKATFWFANYYMFLILFLNRLLTAEKAERADRVEYHDAIVYEPA